MLPRNLDIPKQKGGEAYAVGTKVLDYLLALRCVPRRLDAFVLPYQLKIGSRLQSAQHGRQCGVRVRTNRDRVGGGGHEPMESKKGLTIPGVF